MPAKLFSRLAFSSVFTHVIDHKMRTFLIFFFKFDTDDDDQPIQLTQYLTCMFFSVKLLFFNKRTKTMIA